MGVWNANTQIQDQMPIVKHAQPTRVGCEWRQVLAKFAFQPTICYTQTLNDFLLFLIEITRLQNTLEEYDTQLLLICTILTQIEHLQSKCFYFFLPLSSNDLCVGLKTNKRFMLMLVPTSHGNNMRTTIKTCTFTFLDFETETMLIDWKYIQ